MNLFLQSGIRTNKAHLGVLNILQQFYGSHSRFSLYFLVDVLIFIAIDNTFNCRSDYEIVFLSVTANLAKSPIFLTFSKSPANMPIDVFMKDLLNSTDLDTISLYSIILAISKIDQNII